MNGRIGVIAVALLLASPGVQAAATADPAVGRRIVERWCSSCHVSGAQGGGTDAAPTLDSIAKDRGRGPDRIRGWLADPHPPMPNMGLTRGEIDAVVAYLESLAR
ncbi:mono/diheme cytochrome c family protein [Azospirillum agricola]|uniref:c-type cytochrome n=1 Tax=Azospirillum agricola TaxID=1720247 RepID=UPI001AE97122|nr:cytochrome c [Azospirillum agricola]MBP2227979.1 mono/diheme cytochrome c family protein [Azospirillum agricola]